MNDSAFSRASAAAEGDAPDFDLLADDGQHRRLADYRGRWLVLYFYPKDDTPGCTRQAVELTAEQAAFAERDAVVVGVSRDSSAVHQRFRGKYSLGVQLLSDPERVTHRAYGAWGEKVSYGKKTEGVLRSTFLIDPEGKLRRSYTSVNVDGHVQHVLHDLDLLQGRAPAPLPEKKPAARKTPSKITKKA